jgi:TonB family protein
MFLKASYAYFATMMLFCVLAAHGQAQPPENTDEGKTAPSPVFRVGGGVSAPKAIYAPYPEYSEEAAEVRQMGTVESWLVVGPDGKALDIRVHRTLGMDLDEKAIEAVKNLRFEPGMKDGKPVAVQINVDVNFGLGGSAVSGQDSSQAAPLPSTPLLPKPASPSTPASDAAHDPLGEAMALARKGDCEAAITKYQQVLQEQPKSPDAYAGLARCYLKKRDITQAYETVSKGLQVSDAWVVRVALGEVYFRQGKIHEAEKEWVNVINAGHPSARAYLGMARVRWAIAMNKSANAMIDKAHELDSQDPDIFILRARMKGQDRSCRLVSKVKNTEMPLVRLLLDPKHLRGYGLPVELNGYHSNIMLDTGATGIVIKRSTAEKAGITKVTETKIWGVGNNGPKDAYVGTANTIRVGELEFQDCPVKVMESRSVAEEDGLIGADFFADFLVDIDFPDEKLKLSELPKRPGQANDSEEHEKWDKTEAAPKAGATGTAATADSSGPQDRYIAPEMRSFTRVYRFGHELLVPTQIGDVPNKLFLLDTGSFNNAISPQAAREITKVGGDSRMSVNGISGSVKNVYSANKAVLQFGHLRQENQDMTAFDMSELSESAGVEVSGFFGFVLLRFLDIKIDYRDALVDFSYDAKRFNRF